MIPKELNASLKHFYVFYHSKAFSVSQDPFYYSFFNLRFFTSSDRGKLSRGDSKIIVFPENYDACSPPPLPRRAPLDLRPLDSPPPGISVFFYLGWILSRKNILVKNAVALLVCERFFFCKKIRKIIIIIIFNTYIALFL